MIVTINGQRKTFDTPINIDEYLQQEGYGDMMIAVARNRSFVPKGDYEATILEDGDELDIVAPMQGG